MVDQLPTTSGPDRDDAVLSVRALNVDAGSRRILRDIHLELRPREILAILGPSGVGKTTLLRCLNP
jgi:ABC-type cobalamin/Fe3+-siderophores transport system ATPase subunit